MTISTDLLRWGVVISTGCLSLMGAEPADQARSANQVSEVTAESEASGVDDLQGDPATPAVGDDLMLFEELPVVVSASRQETPQNLAATPVSIISAEDLQRQLAPTLAEAFYFVPGVDVLQLDRNRIALGVRGLHETFSDRTLTLVNGRNADSPVFGGNVFSSLPLMLGDIERIEVVRGPGGAVWGANAFTGVINIITKEPHETPGWFARGTASHHGDGYVHLRHGGSKGAWDWRISAGYEDRVSSAEALDEEGTMADDDWRRSAKVDVDTAWHIGDHDKIRMGIGATESDHGGVNLFNSTDTGDGQQDTVRSYVRWEHLFNDKDHCHVEYFLNAQETVDPATTNYESLEQDLNVELQVGSIEGHEWVFGGNVRAVRIDDDVQDRNDFDVDDTPLDETWIGVFAMDRWRFAQRWLIEAQARVDDYSEGETDYSGRIALIRELDEDGHHVGRIAVARAFRTPLSAIRNLEGRRVFMPTLLGPMPAVILQLPEDDLDNETTVAIEAGYNGRLSDQWHLRIDGYFQEFEDLIGHSSRTDPMTGQLLLQADNLGDAESYGIETEISWNSGRWEVSNWYAWNEFVLEREDQAVRAFLPAEHKIGTTISWRLPRDMSIDLGYRFSSETESAVGPFGYGDADSFHRLDLTFGGARDGIAWRVGMLDVFNDTEQVSGGFGDIQPHETPGRTLIGRLSWEF